MGTDMHKCHGRSCVTAAAAVFELHNLITPTRTGLLSLLFSFAGSVNYRNEDFFESVEEFFQQHLPLSACQADVAMLLKRVVELSERLTSVLEGLRAPADSLDLVVVADGRQVPIFQRATTPKVLQEGLEYMLRDGGGLPIYFTNEPNYNVGHI